MEKKLITKDYYFTVENEITVMYNNKGEVVSDNYFAEQELMLIATSGNYLFIAKDIKYAVEQLKDECFEQWKKENTLFRDGFYSTQDALHKNKLTEEELFGYYYKELV